MAPAPSARPYFIPAAIDYDTLPEPVRRALINVVGPAYHELVERSMTALERTVGVTLVFLLTMEVLDQFALAKMTDFGLLAQPAAASEISTQQRDKLVESHLRLVASKQHGRRILFLDKAEQDAFEDVGGEAGAVAFAA